LRQDNSVKNKQGTMSIGKRPPNPWGDPESHADALGQASGGWHIFKDFAARIWNLQTQKKQATIRTPTRTIVI
jgi:hypothetical protein